MKYIIVRNSQLELVDSIPVGYTGALIEMEDYGDGTWIGTAQLSTGNVNLCVDQVTISYV